MEDYEDKHKYINYWDMMRLDEKIGNFMVNSTMPFKYVDRFDIFIEEAEEDKDYWDVYAEF